MTLTATDLLLEASDVSKTYGAVIALKRASLSVRPGEVHALMGANGAGKSTLVKILTGAVQPDAGTILVKGEARDIHAPAAARRSGLVSVYQEPALIPDLDIAEMKDTCSLDVADRGGITLEEVGEILNLTRERIRQVEVRGLLKLKMDGEIDGSKDLIILDSNALAALGQPR